MLVEILRRLVEPNGELYDATALLMHPAHGLKSRNSAAQLAQYAWAAERSSMAVLRVVEGACPGMSEYEAAGLMGYQGEPLSCHVMLASNSGPIIGLRSPTARVLAEGDGVTTAIGYQGGLCCRAGLLRAEPDESFLDNYVAPYYLAISAWWQTLRIGVRGGELHAAVLDALAGARFSPALNPGHLIAIDEWSHSPIRPGSSDLLASGMALQCDIIPAPMPDGFTLNCEDGVALADSALRAELAAGYPELWSRIQARRNWMHSSLGLTLAEEVLPLSIAPAWLPPFWLAGELVCTIG
jgi:Xaa-Pro aminopeptidase